MTLPDFIAAKLESLLSKYPTKSLKDAYQELSDSYRTQRERIATSLDSEQKRLAYVAARFPATYSAVSKVLQEIEQGDTISTVLDVGAGCGTASFAACERFPHLSHVTFIEHNAGMVEIGKALSCEHPLLKNAQWLNTSMHKNDLENPGYDLIILSYSLNEITETEREKLIQKFWSMTNKYLVIVEPGTQNSFQLIHTLRSFFIKEGAKILAPCPHTNACPAFTAGDLCHFSSRVQRTSLHRYLKQGEKSFEDEKYCYLVLSKESAPRYEGRVVWEPSTRSGFISLKVCTTDGFKAKNVTKKDKASYTELRKAEWGDRLAKI